MRRKSVGYRLSEEAKALIVKLAQHLGISQTDVVEQAVRALAREQGILPESQE